MGEKKVNLPTNLDNMRAMLYANTRILNDTCDRTKDIWVPDPAHQLFPCPEGVTHCGYGQCRAGTKERCQELSQVPFNPSTGEDIPAARCDVDPCPEGMTCIDTLDENGNAIKKCVFAKPYLEWRDNEKKCIFGNFAHRRWCLFPKARRETPQPGVTDVPPFRYDELTGKCHITPDYCKKMQVDWDSDKGECKLSVGQWIGEFLLGRTIFRGIKGAGNVFQENFGGAGVHLYQSNHAVGLDEEELHHAYPNGGPSLHSPDPLERRAYKLMMMQRLFNKTA